MARNIIYWFADNVMPWLFIGSLAFLSVLILALVVGAISALTRKSTPPIVLNANEWECTQWHEERYMTTILVGKVIVPQWRMRTVADVYVRRGFLGEQSTPFASTESPARGGRQG